MRLCSCPFVRFSSKYRLIHMTHELCASSDLGYADEELTGHQSRRIVPYRGTLPVLRCFCGGSLEQVVCFVCVIVLEVRALFTAFCPVAARDRCTAFAFS